VHSSIGLQRTRKLRSEALSLLVVGAVTDKRAIR
jgi:hypothetical protein